MPYRVGRNAAVDEQIKSLAATARKLGIFKLYQDALLKIVELLTNAPLDFGDPDYHTKLPGGIICHAVHQPLLVRFAVFEDQQIVQILEIKAFSGSVFFTR
jgi:hypothetical protein